MFSIWCVPHFITSAPSCASGPGGAATQLPAGKQILSGSSLIQTGWCVCDGCAEQELLSDPCDPAPKCGTHGSSCLELKKGFYYSGSCAGGFIFWFLKTFRVSSNVKKKKVTFILFLVRVIAKKKEKVFKLDQHEAREPTSFFKKQITNISWQLRWSRL